MLTIIATPIGNLKDITLRAIEVLKEVDAIVCEDTRRTAILLSHYQIEKPLIVLNDFNESSQFPIILNKLIQGTNLALVSDAGTPLISDPGYKLVRECLSSGIKVDSLPGPSSVVTSLTLSGLPPDKFTFLGYLPEKPGKREELLKNLVKISSYLSTTYIVFVSPHKLVNTLEELRINLGDIPICVATELTKIHQKIITKLISEYLLDLKSDHPKGEYILLFNLSLANDFSKEDK